MKNSKFMIVFLLAAIIFSMCACGKAKEKITEKAMEKVVGDAIGGKVNITKDGGKIEVNGETYEAGENLDWPKDAMGELPEPKAKVTFVMKDDANMGCTVTVEEFSVKDAEKYLEMLKEKGFKEGMNISDEDGIMFTGKKDDGSVVNFIYNPDSKDGTIAYSSKVDK